MHTNSFDRTDNFGRIYKSFVRKLLAFGALTGDKPHQMHEAGDEWAPVELTNCVIEYSIPHGIDRLMVDTQPNLPWAETHFQERVSGVPHNPPPSHVSWPYAQRGNEEHLIDGKFSHTYPERIWPKYCYGHRGWVHPEAMTHYEIVGEPPNHEPRVVNHGIRFNYGDLNDLLTVLAIHPDTRQAYLPIWFPEDLTAAKIGERVPCTLGYHFLLREGKLNITYFIRSCDIVRYLRDDVYMACRLAQWICHEMWKSDNWEISPGHLHMHICSLHCFVGDLTNLRRDYAIAGS